MEDLLKEILAELKIVNENLGALHEVLPSEKSTARHVTHLGEKIDEVYYAVSAMNSGSK